MTIEDEHAERALVGIALMSDAAARGIVDRGVKAEHFTSRWHRPVFVAIAELVDEGAYVDLTSVNSRLQRHGTLDELGGFATLDGMTADAVGVGSVITHCDNLIDTARWRHLHSTASTMVAASEAMDRKSFEDAENSLWQTDEHRARRTDWTPESAAEDFMTAFEDETQDVFPWPFEKLNLKSDGGAARGEITILAGPVTHGKSAFLDMCLESMHKPGLQVRLYLNEMKRRQRLARVCARRSGVELHEIQKAMRGNLVMPEHDLQLVRNSWANYPVNITECNGWPIDRICRHARRSGCDIMALDILNRLPFGDSDRSRTQQLEDAAAQLDRLAKDCEMHIVIVTHLNRNRTVSGRAPIPALSDIKECAALGEIADNVIFVWREPDENGDPTDTGAVRLAKCRTGELGGPAVHFDGPHQTFRAIDPHLTAVAS